MHTHWSTLADTIAEVESVGEKRGNAHAVVDTLGDTLEVKESVGETSGDAHALVETLAGVTSLLWPELRLVRA